MSEVPTFSEFLTEDSPGDASDTQPEAQEQAGNVEEVTTQAEDSQSPEPEAAGDVTSEAVEQVEQPSQEAPLAFEARLAARGYDVDEDVDREELYDRAIDQISENAKLKQQLAAIQKELESAKASAPTAPEAQQPAQPLQVQQEAQEEQSTTQQVNRVFRKLEKYDPSLKAYVTFENGRALPKAEYGAAAIDAANQINAYEAEAARQADLLLTDPTAIITENQSLIEKLVEERAKSLFDSKFSSWQEEQEKARARQAEEAAKRQEEETLYEWHNKNKDWIFKVDENGEPKKDPLDPSRLAMTGPGRRFQEVLSELKEENPGASHLSLMNIAARLAKAETQHTTQNTAPEPPLKAKQKFTQQRQTVPQQSSQPATVNEVLGSQGGLGSFSDWVYQDPDNTDKISGWQ